MSPPRCPMCNKRHELGSGTVQSLVMKCSGCKKEYFQLQLHPETPEQCWCMNCFGHRFGVKEMENQRLQPHLTSLHKSGHTASELWEYPCNHFKDMHPMRTVKTMKDFHKIQHSVEMMQKYKK